MNLYLPLRTLVLLSLLGLLAGCAADAPAPAAAPVPATPAQPEVPRLPAYLRELSGQLLGVPLGAEVELALLAIDRRGRPETLLGNIQLRGTGQALSFQLPFNPEAFNKHPRVELHGRAHQSGRLILHLPALPISRAETQALGTLRLVPAP